MTNVWCVRAGSGAYADQFVRGGYVGVNFGVTSDLSKALSRDELMDIYRTAHSDETSNLVIGQQVGRLARCLREIQEWLGLEKGLVRAT